MKYQRFMKYPRYAIHIKKIALSKNPKEELLNWNPPERNIPEKTPPQKIKKEAREAISHIQYK